MTSFLKYLFSYVPPEPLPEMPKDEPPDPNENRVLPEAVRVARRSLLIVCGLCLAWASAQFVIIDSKIVVAGVSMEFKGASIPIVLAVVLLYLTVRWGIEFAMMPRHVRRWPLARFDFNMVFLIARFSLLALAAGVLDQSLLTVALVIALVGLLVIVSGLLTGLLMFVTMPIRMRARSLAGRPSAANAAYEALVWAILFAIVITASAIVVMGVASYRYAPLRDAMWHSPPHPVALSVFILTLITVSLIGIMLIPVINRIFAEPPGYYTERDSSGGLRFCFTENKKEPLV